MAITSRISVDQKAVKFLLNRGISAYAAGKRLRIPTSVCYAIAKGKNRPYYIPKGAFKDRAKKKLCERCGRREIYEGFSKLCLICWKIGD